VILKDQTTMLYTIIGILFLILVVSFMLEVYLLPNIEIIVPREEVVVTSKVFRIKYHLKKDPSYGRWYTIDGYMFYDSEINDLILYQREKQKQKEFERNKKSSLLKQKKNAMKYLWNKDD
jgi:hypothetical protein